MLVVISLFSRSWGSEKSISVMALAMVNWVIDVTIHADMDFIIQSSFVILKLNMTMDL